MISKYLMPILAVICCFRAWGQIPTFLKYYNAPFPCYENTSAAVIQTRDSGYAFTGTSIVQTSAVDFEGHITLFKTRPTGTLQWSKELPIHGCVDANGYAINELWNGYMVAGACSYGLYLIRTNTNGDTVWTRSVPYYVGVNVSMSRSADNGFIVTGVTQYTDSSRVLKFDSTGALQWTKLYNFHYKSAPAEIRSTSDGGYILLNSVLQMVGSGGVANGAELVKLDATGDTMWTSVWYDTTTSYMQSVLQTSDGGYMATGGPGLYGCVLKFHADGSLQWALRTTGKNYGVYEEPGFAWYVASWSIDYKIAFQKINYSGSAVIWRHEYGAGYPEYTSGFAHTLDGGFIISGYGANDSGHGRDILVKLDTNGVENMTGIKELSAVEWNLYPNPATTNITIRASERINAAITITDMAGHTLYGAQMKYEMEKQLPVAAFPKGVYTISIRQNGSETIVRRFIKS